MIVFRERTNIFYLEEDFPNLHSPAPIRASPSAITSIYGLPVLDLDHLEQYEDDNKIRINVLKIVERRKHNKTVLRAQKHYTTPGCKQNANPKIDVAVESWPSTQLYWLPCSSLIESQMVCTVTETCKFTFEWPADLKKHEKICSAEQTVVGEQKYYGSGKTVMDDIIADGYLPDSFKNYRNKTITTFDIETVQECELVKTISIAVSSSIDGTKYFERETSAKEDFQKLVNEFMAYLIELKDQIELPEEIENALAELEEEISALERGLKKSRLLKYSNHLKLYRKLNTFGFNSSKFDIPVLIGGILNFAYRSGLKVDPLKNTSKYITLQVDDILFKDTLHYSSPCSLDRYLVQWKAPEAKGIFPHGHFKSIEEIRNTVDFPDKVTFWSKLKQQGPSDEEYNEAKSMYDRNIAAGNWKNFSDYLQWYNCQDVGPLVIALTNSFDKFFEYFGIDPLIRLSLPSIAFEAMFNTFDQSLPYVASFNKNNDDVRELFRDKVEGGVTNVYHRDIDLMGSDSPESARIAPNGDPYTSVIMSDANSMYLKSQDEDLPLTPGIKWELNGSKFKKTHMSSQISFKALQWIYMEQESSRCVDKQGRRVTIEHHYHQGERTIFNSKVDGYALIDDEHVIWEFNGCFWHGCLECYPDWFETATQEAIERQISWNMKIERLKANNCKIYIMKEHEFVVESSIPTRMARILVDDTPASLLEAIRTKQVFGFAKCSVRTPPELIEKFAESSFLFPPIIKRSIITEDLVSPFMKEVMIEQERKAGQSTLIQTYNGDDLLLMTPLIQFYLEEGLEVFNITSFIQYIPGRGLAPFVDKVVTMRMEATDEGDDAKQLTAKLFGNAGYGKCAENVLKHKNTSLYPADYDVNRIACKALYRDHSIIHTEEGEASGWEVTCDKKTVCDSKPVHIGVCILQWSKLLILRYMFFLYHHLQCGSFKSVYADTDSMCLALTKTRAVTNDSEEEKYRALFDPIIRPEMRESWEKTWKQWFCTTNETIDIRKPGKWKTEFMFQRGRFCALSPKTYFAYNETEEEQKTGHKGVCHAEARKLTLNAYLECLYGSTTALVQNRGFKLNNQKQLVYYELLKRGLNSVFYKFRVQNDRITCKPLLKNDQVL